MRRLVALGAIATLTAAAPAPGLEARLEAIAKAAGGRVGAAMTLIETGRQVGWRTDERFPAQSVYKLPIAIAALAEAERRKQPLDAPVEVIAADLVPGPYPSPVRAAYQQGRRRFPLRELVHQAIAVSDNTASDALLRLAGGPAAVNAHMHAIGLTGITVATPIRHFEPEQNTATPRAVMTLLVRLHRGQGVSAESRAVILEAMRACTTSPGRLKGLLPKGAVVAHKTGTSGTYGGVTLATNDVGLITLPDGRHVAIAVFLKNARVGEARRDRTIAEVARAAWDAWSRP